MWNAIGKFPLLTFFKDSRNVLKNDELGIEIANIALPATLALLADPLASLVDTAFIGRIGAVELASVGVSIAIFNQISRITMFPLVSITTSFVAEEEATSRSSTETEQDGNVGGIRVDDHEMVPLTGSSNMQTDVPEDRRVHVPSASSALIIGCVLGIFQTFFLIFTAKHLLHYMGVKPESPMLKIAQQYLRLRSLGAPAILLSLAVQGVFRGLKDTKTPLYAIIIGDSTNVLLDPIFMFTFDLGVKGFQLLIKVIFATSCVTVAASLAARLGPKPMAAFQVCLQIWMATSLLADGLAVAGQAILASAFAQKDYEKTVAAASRVLQIGVVLGLLLSFILGIASQFASELFTQDVDVLKLMSLSFPFIAGTQPINALAFVFDGVNYGASDFAYSACSMVLVAVISILCLLLLSSSHGYIGIWVALSIFMSLRVFVGLLRIGTGMGPWSFLRS